MQLNLKVWLPGRVANNNPVRPMPSRRPKHKQLSFPLTGLSVINSDYGAELSWPTSEATVPGVRSQRSRWLETSTATSWPNGATASSSLSKPTAGAIPDILADHRSPGLRLLDADGAQRWDSRRAAATIAMKGRQLC